MSTDISCLTLCCVWTFSREKYLSWFCLPCNEHDDCSCLASPAACVLSALTNKDSVFALAIVSGYLGRKHMLQGIVLLYVADAFQQTIFVPSKHWQTCIMVLIWWFHIHPCQFLYLHIVPVMYVESRKIAHWSSPTSSQWERPPADLIILIMPCPVHKFSESHPQRRSLLLTVSPCSRYVVYISGCFRSKL